MPCFLSACLQFNALVVTPVLERVKTSGMDKAKQELADLLAQAAEKAKAEEAAEKKEQAAAAAEDSSSSEAAAEASSSSKEGEQQQEDSSEPKELQVRLLA